MGVFTFPCPVIVRLVNLTPGANLIKPFLASYNILDGSAFIRSHGRSDVIRHDGKDLAILKISNLRRKCSHMKGCMGKIIKHHTTLCLPEEHCPTKRGPSQVP